jgi:hypothetical protein
MWKKAGYPGYLMKSIQKTWQRCGRRLTGRKYRCWRRCGRIQGYPGYLLKNTEVGRDVGKAGPPWLPDGEYRRCSRDVEECSTTKGCGFGPHAQVVRIAAPGVIAEKY